MKLIWVRHGETDLNNARRYLGHTDAPLNERGKDQARQVAQLLKTERVSRLYTSDLTRCRETAVAISRACELGCVSVRALRESNFGEWEGKTYEEIMQQAPKLASLWYDHPFDVAPPGGETLRDLGQRLDGWLRQMLLTAAPDETIVLVSHGGPIRWFQSKWVAQDEARFWDVQGLPHGQIYSVFYGDDGTWKER